MGTSDCELLRDGWLAQPVNAWSSLAYVVAAVVVVAGRRRAGVDATVDPAVAALGLALVGVGSFAFHGPQPPRAGALHDAAIEVLLVVVIAHLLRRRTADAVAVATVAATIVVALPEIAVLVHGGTVLVAAAVAVRERNISAVALAAGAAGLVLYVLGRTDGPLCTPTSPAQPHAAWHVLTAVAAAAVLAGHVAPRRATGRGH